MFCKLISPISAKSVAWVSLLKFLNNIAVLMSQIILGNCLKNEQVTFIIIQSHYLEISTLIVVK